MDELCMDKKNMGQWLGVTVKEIKPQVATQKGDNNLSEMKRLVVIAENGDSYPLVVKCRYEEGPVAALVNEANIFPKEQEMYAQILPKLSHLLKQVEKDGFKYMTPKCYHSCDKAIVMEDLSVAGFRMRNRMVGLDLDQALLVLRNLARMHAASVILYEEDPQFINNYQSFFFTQPRWSMLFKALSENLSDELNTWSEEFREYADHIRKMAGEVTKRVQELTQREAPFKVLLHGDLWTNNILIRDKPPGVRFVDFQFVYFGTPAMDLHFFYTTSLTLDVRRRHMEYLTKEYHTTLCDTLTALGYKKKLITLEELHEEMDDKVFYGIFSLVCPLPVHMNDPESSFCFEEVLLNGKKPGPSFLGETYKAIVKLLLPLYAGKGGFNKLN